MGDKTAKLIVGDQTWEYPVLEGSVGPMLTDTYQFGGARCERMTDRVIARLNELR